MFQEISQCPQCKAAYTQSEEGPLYCAKCRFPLKLIAHKYRLLEPVAEGGFGTIYRAAHIYLESDRERAIKILKAHVLQSSENIERFYREVRVTMSLSQRNEHIVRIYDDFGQDPDLGFFYVMEHLRGRPLSALLGRGGLPLPFVLEVAWQVCDAIATCHRASVVHRDLKPENIFLTTREGHETFIKVLDFGIAKTMMDTQAPNLTQGILGTPIYMSPEQAEGVGIGPASDVYALGIILYEMLAGMPPFGYPSPQQQGSFMEMLRAHATQIPPPLREKRADTPEECARWIDQMLCKSPDERPASMEMLRDAFRSLSRRFGGATGTYTKENEEDLAVTDVRGFSYPAAGLPSSSQPLGSSLPVSAEIATSHPSGDLSPRVPALSFASPKAQEIPFLDAPRINHKLSSATPKAQHLQFDPNSLQKRPKKRRVWPWLIGLLCLVGVGILLWEGDAIWEWIGLRHEVPPSSPRTSVLSQKAIPSKNPQTELPPKNRMSPQMEHSPSHRISPSAKALHPRDIPATKPTEAGTKAQESPQRPIDGAIQAEKKQQGGVLLDDMGASALEKVAGKLRQMGQAKHRMQESSRKGDLLGTLQGAKQMLGHVMEILPPAKRKSATTPTQHIESSDALGQDSKAISQEQDTTTEDAAYRAAEQRLAAVQRLQISPRYPYLAQYHSLVASLRLFGASREMVALRGMRPLGGFCALSLEAAGQEHVGREVLSAYKQLHAFRDMSVIERERLRRIVAAQARAAFASARQMADVAARGLAKDPRRSCFLATKRRQRSLQAFLLHPQHAAFR